MTRQAVISYEKLLKFCKTDTQLLTIESIIKHGSQAKAAKALKITTRNVEKTVKLVRDYAMRYGKEAMIGTVGEPVPEGFFIKGSSVLYDAETGEAKIAWVKTDVDKDRQLQLAIESFQESLECYKPLPKIKAPTKTDKNLITVYPMGDPHIGMYAWSAEAGEDFDCEIAERDLRAAVAHLVDKSPPTETAVILNLGDFFHSDTQENRTARAGNALDVDGRWARVLEIGITLMIDCVNLALEKHKKVIVKNNIGNHDTHTSQVLSICMQHAFKGNPRVEIAEPANPFFAFKFGKTAIFSTHGHMVKPAKAHGWITNYYPEIWGATEHRYAYFGHFHHEDREEKDGLTREIFNTLASSDAWHHSAGYRSKRNMKSIVLHKEHGEVERYTYSIAREKLS